jgi:parallel beta-helix repeat protein
MLSGCDNRPSYDPARSYKSIEKSLAAQLMMAKDSSVIELDEGHFIFKNSLILEGKHHVTIRGKGMDKTVLSFKIQESGAEGLRVANCSNIILENFAIEDAAGDNIKVTDTEGITFRNIKSAWTGQVTEENGAYGLYPVLCRDVVIEGCEVLGASDAGIYVGQSVNVSIKNNIVYWNVAGIESENSENVVIEGNEAFENTGGILIFDLPGLTMYGKNIKAYQNKVYENNLKNFAPPGNIVGVVPPGTGFLILATRNVEIYENEVTDNKTIGAGIISYDLVAAMRGGKSGGNNTPGAQGVNQNYKKDTDYDPYPGGVFIHDNKFSNAHFIPDLGNDFGKLLMSKFGLSLPVIAWDGIRAPGYLIDESSINPDYKICVNESDDLKIANLDAGNGFENISTDVENFRCEIK